MDNIIVPGLTTGQINDYVTKFNEAHAADGVNAALQVDQAGNKALVITTANGKSLTLSLTDAPDIDPANITPEEQEEALQDFGKKIEDFAKELDSGDKQKSPSMNVLCDIFSLILMLLKVSQAQRDTMSAIRQQGHAAVQANIAAQAESIRQQAEQAFTLGLAGAIVSSIMTSASLGMAIAGAVNQVKAIKTSDINSAMGDLKASENQLKNITASMTEPRGPAPQQVQGLSDQQMTSVGLRPGNSEAENLEIFKKAYMPETVKAETAEQQAKAEWDNLKTRAEGTKNVMAQKETQLEAAKAKEELRTIKDAFANFKNELGNETAAKFETLAADQHKNLNSNLSDAQLIENAGEDSGITEENVGQFRQFLAMRESQADAQANFDKFHMDAATVPSVQEAAEQFDSAKRNYDQAVGDADKAHAKWAVKMAEVQDAQDKDAKRLNNLTKVANKAADHQVQIPDPRDANRTIPVDAQKLAQAQGIFRQIESAQDHAATVSVVEGLKMKVDHARAKLGQVANVMNGSKNAQLSKMFDNLINVSGQLSTTINKFLDTYKERNAGISEAQRKLLEAEIDKGRALIEDADDLRQAAQSQVSSFIQSMMAILQMENQTNLQMIRG